MGSDSDTLRIAADVANLEAVAGFVKAQAERCSLDAGKKNGLLIALEEAFVNICHYGYPNGGGGVEIACGCDGDVFAVEITDSGIAFDMLSLPEPDITADIAEREIGGLGVHLIRTLTDEVSWRREDDRNVLRMVFRRGRDEGL